MKIAIITDGNNILGMGHVYQSLTLAKLLMIKALSSSNIYFLTKSSDYIVKLIEEQGFSAKQLINDDAIFEELNREKPDRIIFDKLDVSPDLALKIKKVLSIKLSIFTNLTEANKYADITVLADIGSNFENIHRRDKETGQVQFWGPKYWLLRTDFHEYKQKQKIRIKSTKNILLIFGGADSSNLTSAVLKSLLNIDKSFNINIILGSAFIHNKELDEVLKSNIDTDSNVNILKNINNVAEMMYNSDVVFASPGLSFFEALVVGTPVIGFHQNKLQKDVYNGFLTTIDISELYMLHSIIENQAYIFPDDPFIQSMEIGEGFDEILTEIMN